MIVFTIIGIILLTIYLFVLKPEIEIDKQFKNWCADKNINPCNYYSTPTCYNDCEKLGLEYFKIESGGFGYGNLNCWCKEGNSTKQIW